MSEPQPHEPGSMPERQDPTPEEVLYTMSDKELMDRLSGQLGQLEEGQAMEFMPDGTMRVHSAFEVDSRPTTLAGRHEWLPGDSSANWLTGPVPVSPSNVSYSFPERPLDEQEKAKLKPWWDKVPSPEEVVELAKQDIAEHGPTPREEAPTLVAYDPEHEGLVTIDFSIRDLIAKGEIGVAEYKEELSTGEGPTAKAEFGIGAVEYLTKKILGEDAPEDSRVVFVTHAETPSGVVPYYDELTELGLPSTRKASLGATRFSEPYRSPVDKRTSFEQIVKNAEASTKEALRKLGTSPEIVRIRPLPENFRALHAQLARQGKSLVAKLEVTGMEELGLQLLASDDNSKTVEIINDYEGPMDDLVFESARKHVERSQVA
jgi:hypothetical protein